MMVEKHSLLGAFLFVQRKNDNLLEKFITDPIKLPFKKNHIIQFDVSALLKGFNVLKHLRLFIRYKESVSK